MKLKKIFSLLILGATIGATVSCSDFLDVNTDPNTPSDVSSSLILPAAQNSTATVVGGDMFNYAGFFVQYFEQAPEANQYNAIAKYDLKNEFFDRNYDELYAGALNDYVVAIQKANEEGETGNILAATVMKAYTMQYIVDILDFAPYTEAFLGAAKSAPAWDAGSTVYAGLIKEIDDAIKAYNANPTDVTVKDMIFGGGSDGTSDWLRMANSVKLKLMIRGGITNGLSDLIASDFFIKEDVTFDNYADEANKQNPWYGTNISSSGLGTSNVIGAYPVVQTLSNLSDPRLAVLFDKNKDDEYYGNFPGYKDESNNAGQKTEEFSEPIYTATQAVVLYSVAEVNFFLAEYYSSTDAAKAKDYYEAAVTANFDYHGVSLGNYLTTNPYNGIESIGKQKWLALCMVNHVESWCETRRLDYPAISSKTAVKIASGDEIYETGTLVLPHVNLLGTSYIYRLPYPQSAKTLNPNTPDQPGMGTKVWWD